MTQNEKIETLKVMLNDEEVSDEELITLLTLTKYAILNKRYPLGYSQDKEVPIQYEGIQLQACIVLYNKRGVEGQISHSENGINRSYETGDIPNSLLNNIIPVCGGVKSEKL